MSRGMENLMNGVLVGVGEYRKKQKEKEEAEAAEKWIIANGPKMGLPINVEDAGELKTMVKGFGGGAKALQVLTGLQDHQQRIQTQKAQEEAARAHVAQIAAQREQEKLNREALAAAAAPITVPATTRVRTAEEGAYIMRDPTLPVPETTREPTVSEAVLSYLKRQGNDPHVLRALVDREQTKMQTDQRATSAERRAELAEQKLEAANNGGMIFESESELEKRYPAASNDYSKKVDPRTGRVKVASVSPRAPVKQEPNEFWGAQERKFGEQVAAIIEKVPEHHNTLEQVQRGRAALAAGAKTGGLAAAKLAAAQTINGVMGSEVFKTAPTELAKTTFADMALTAAARMRGQGQITESERKILADSVAKLGNSPEALGYIMNFMEKAAQRSIGKAQAVQELRDANEKTSAPYTKVLSNWERDNPIELEESASVPPPQSAVDYLKKNPSLAAKFDEKYGAGASKRYLKK